MQRVSWLVFPVLAACTTAVPDGDTTADAMRLLVEEHAEASSSAGSMMDVRRLESAYLEDWSTLRRGMDGDCPMADHMGGMQGGDGPMSMMDEAMAQHVEGQQQHEHAHDCTAEEAHHAEAMMGMIDEMCAHMGDGMGGQGMGGMGGGGMGEGAQDCPCSGEGL